MPIYEYECADCGEFTLLRPMSEATVKTACPACNKRAERIMSTPQIMSMSPLAKMACERNEKSRFEPRVSKTGCRHKHPRKEAAAPALKSPQRTRHRYTGARPWVIEHR